MADLDSLISRVRTRAGARSRLDQRLLPLKRRAVDIALDASDATTIADLGAVWRVDAGYTFYALARRSIQRAYIVDETIPERVRTRADADPRIHTVCGMLGDPMVAAQVQHVDALFVFDVLLHQVRPDWDEVLRMYATSARAVAIVNPQWTGSATTAVRLTDLGREEYERNVPDLPLHRRLFDRLDDENAERGRSWRDVHDVWQWGIPDATLRVLMQELGFSAIHEETGRRWADLPNFADHAFVFARSAS